MKEISMWNPDRESTSEAREDTGRALAGLSASEGGIVLLIAGIVLGGILAGATLLLRSLRGHKDDALVP
jgi:hypothetical protein